MAFVTDDLTSHDTLISWQCGKERKRIVFYFCFLEGWIMISGERREDAFCFLMNGIWCNSEYRESNKLIFTSHTHTSHDHPTCDLTKAGEEEES